jgi:formiminotetrahydrofolate cyclodeaminase
VSVAGVPAGGGPFAELTVTQLLDSLAARTSAPAGGSAAAVSVALAAALCGMAARFSEASLGSAAEIARAADRLRERALQLADEDASAYAAVLAARRLPTDIGGDERDATLSEAMARAIAVPLEIAEIGGEIGLLATRLASEGNPNLLGDALTAMLLAEAAASAATTIAEINLGDQPSELAAEA